MSAPLIIDDRDPAILYTPSDGDTWSRAGSRREYQHTTSGTRVEGASAEIRFTGAGIVVRGTLDAKNTPGLSDDNPRLKFTLDNDASTSRVHVGVRDVGAQYSVVFYSNRDLKYGNHSLTMTNMRGRIWLDSFEIYDTPEKTGLSKSAIGGIVGGIVALVVVIAVVVFRWRQDQKAKRAKQPPSIVSAEAQTPAVTPPRPAPATAQIAPFVHPQTIVPNPISARYQRTPKGKSELSVSASTNPYPSSGSFLSATNTAHTQMTMTSVQAAAIPDRDEPPPKYMAFVDQSHR